MLDQTIQETGIAIIGMACRFPGAENSEAFWRNLCAGVESVSVFTDAELRQSSPELLNNPDYVKAGAILSDIDQFDAAFFGYSPKEATLMDPQQRIFLECAWEAMEQAGYTTETYAGLIGVFAGSSLSTYLANNLNPTYLTDQAFIEADRLQLQIKQGNDRNYLPTRVSYKLNLQGPSINTQAACSTGLVAVHLACQSILNGESEMALAGGVSLTVPDKGGYLYEENMIRSPDGHCRAFDAAAAGTLFGNGVGIVVLKSLSAAIADSDHVLAVIKGGAVNNDGALKVDFTAPNMEAQADVIAQALSVAEIDASTITYVEAHGTGTQIGDPIEIAALTDAFGRASQETLYPEQCALGSVKTNIGHLGEAAGIAGLIKTVLALQHQQIPPSLHFQQPNPQIDFASSPFYVNTELTEWLPYGVPRRAGVSSFGMGGTNCHLVLEEAPPVERTQTEVTPDGHLLALSAKTPAALAQLIARYADYLATEAGQGAALSDISFTAHTGRQHFAQRAAFVAESKAQLSTQLARYGEAAEATAGVPEQLGNLALLFTGQGSQYVNMGQGLYRTQPVFRAAIEQCHVLLQPYLSQPLLEVLYPAADSASLIDETRYTQPALFAVEYALYKLWISWGIQPTVVMGHSVGEYVAACVAGVFSLEDGLRLIAARGRLIQALPAGGGMVAVRASQQQIAPLIQPYATEVALAAMNGPRSLVLSGQQAALGAVVTELQAAGIKTRPLVVSHAFHSPLMEPMLAEFADIANQVNYTEPDPQIKLISNVTGQLVGADIATAAYWVKHVRAPVNFAAGMQTLDALNVSTFIEAGPKPILLGMGRQCLPDHAGLWLPSLRPNKPDGQHILSSLRQLYLAGADINWVGYHQPYAARRVPLPTYPWQRERYWVEPAPAEQSSIDTSA